MRRSPPRFHDTPPALPPNLSLVLGISPSAMTLGLGNVKALLDALGHPERRFRSILVAGTNGKGSVTSYLSAILANSGLHVGWYSSPHIYDVTERIRINGAQITRDEMEEAAARIVPLYEQIGYSYFEALTAIAFIVFAERGVDIAVLEIGLGGRFDATNVVDPDISVLTHIGLDHRRILGDTKEEILREKLGIARPNTPLLVGPLDDALMAIVEERARNDRIELVPFGALGAIELETLAFEGMRARIRTEKRDYGTVRLPFAGEHQLGNALLAVGAAERIIGPVDDLDGAADAAKVAGRFEVHEMQGRHVILDVAHNDDALIAAARTLGALSPRSDNAIVLGLLDRKELVDFPAVVSQWIGRLILVQPEIDEWLAPPMLLERLGVANLRDKGLDIVLQPWFEREDQWRRFLDHTFGAKGACRSVLITGSHRTVELFGRFLFGVKN